MRALLEDGNGRVVHLFRFSTPFKYGIPSAGL
jgi:hypothetical protein